MPNETAPAYMAFLAYIGLPAEDRTLLAAAEASGSKYGSCKQWSPKYLWRQRAIIYDMEQLSGDPDKAAEANEEHAKLLRDAVPTAIETLLCIATGKLQEKWTGIESDDRGRLKVPTKDRVGAAMAILDRAGLPAHEAPRTGIEIGEGGTVNLQIINGGHPDDPKALATEDPLGLEPGPAPTPPPPAKKDVH